MPSPRGGHNAVLAEHPFIPKIIGASGQTPAGRSSFFCFISISWGAM